MSVAFNVLFEQDKVGNIMAINIIYVCIYVNIYKFYIRSSIISSLWNENNNYFNLRLISRYGNLSAIFYIHLDENKILCYHWI